MVDQVANQCYRAKHQSLSTLLRSCKCLIFMPKGLSRAQIHLCSWLQLSSECEHQIRSLELVTAATACAQQDTRGRSKKCVNLNRIHIRPQRSPPSGKDDLPDNTEGLDWIGQDWWMDFTEVCQACQAIAPVFALQPKVHTGLPCPDVV